MTVTTAVTRLDPAEAHPGKIVPLHGSSRTVRGRRRARARARLVAGPTCRAEVGQIWNVGVFPHIGAGADRAGYTSTSATHRCVFYGKFSQFAKDLEELIRGIEASEQTVEP